MERRYKLRSVDVWDEESQPILIGVISKFETIDVGKDARDTMIIDTGLAMMRVWHSEAIKEAFELGVPGDGIRLEYKGKVPIQGGHTFKRISVQVWEGGDLDQIAKEAKSDTGPTTT